MSYAFHQRAGGPAAQTVPSSQPTQDDSLALDLREHVHRLRLIRPVVSVSVMALRCQNAELDTDITSVLSQRTCGPLDCEIAHLESILVSRTCRCRQQEAQA
jgi:hypothetical protein